VKYKKPLTITLFAVAVLVLLGIALAQAPATTPVYKLIDTIAVPGGLAGFDISWVDPGSQRYYLADRTATKGTGRIDVIDTQTDKLLYTIPTRPTEYGFVGTVPAPKPGCSASGPNGVVAIPQLNQLYVGDGDSTVKVVDLDAKAVVAIIPTGGQCRADELNYDAIDHIIMIANPSDDPPFVTFISTDTQTVVGKYVYPSAQSGQHGAGLEQPVFSPVTKRFYLTVPALMGSKSGSVDVFNPMTMQMEKSYPTPNCSPAGLIITANQHLVTSCGTVMDLQGNILTTVSNVSTDQIWYNPGDNLIYWGAPMSGAVDAETNQLLAPLPETAGHTLAVDPWNNKIFAPVTGKGIKVFAAQ
jgi:hypothetical protein